MVWVGALRCRERDRLLDLVVRRCGASTSSVVLVPSFSGGDGSPTAWSSTTGGQSVSGLGAALPSGRFGALRCVSGGMTIGVVSMKGPAQLEAPRCIIIIDGGCAPREGGRLPRAAVGLLPRREAGAGGFVVR